MSDMTLNLDTDHGFDQDSADLRERSMLPDFTCNACGTRGTLTWMSNHPCRTIADIADFGGRCEDFPCCGHVGADAGCAPQQEHTSDYWFERMTNADGDYDLDLGDGDW